MGRSRVRSICPPLRTHTRTRAECTYSQSKRNPNSCAEVHFVLPRQALCCMPSLQVPKKGVGVQHMHRACNASPSPNTISRKTHTKMVLEQCCSTVHSKPGPLANPANCAGVTGDPTEIQRRPWPAIPHITILWNPQQHHSIQSCTSHLLVVVQKSTSPVVPSQVQHATPTLRHAVPSHVVTFVKNETRGLLSPAHKVNTTAAAQPKHPLCRHHMALFLCGCTIPLICGVMQRACRSSTDSDPFLHHCKNARTVGAISAGN